MSWDDWLPATRGELRNLWSYVMDQTDHITRIGEQVMARVDELVTRLNDATDELARDLSALRDEVAGLDQSVADKFQPLVERLEGLGADPQDPVPAPEEPVNPGVPEDVTNPTPGAQDNPNA